MGTGGSKLSPKDMMEMQINMRIQAKMLHKSALKAEKQAEKEKQKIKKAMEKGQIENARIFAENAIRQKNQMIAHERLSSRLDAVASKLQTSQASMKVAHNLGIVAERLGPAMNAMNISQMASSMDDFEKVLEDQEVFTHTMSSTINNATSTMTPHDDVDDLLAEVAMEHGMDSGAMMPAAGVGQESQGVRQLSPEEDDALERQLASLRN
eukprot:TRINITY_DN30640_c0_g1_i1.p1 TRINITY_DN30640_c0_g1~~TRINITY_DN30640_c0_g1_i1.p1  ORF type:complete len:210 (-),score=71.94 TRINITY_DN30640_c0_g1_i1:163-792(-)